ncbi:MAG: glycosyltransferase family 4 protein [Acidobacteria bacterium]|nr:glycosyltransferase family 4 protein [Acidobacteriota bacterium]
MKPAGLRILHTNFHRGWGGQPSRILMLSRSLMESGHEVVIAAPAGSMLAEKASRSGLETFEEPRFLKSKHLASAMRDATSLHRLLLRRQFDLLDAHGSQDLWTAAAALKLGRHALPLIYTRHNTKRVAFHPLNRFLYRTLVNHLIVASASVLERYEPFLRHGDLSRERISIVHSSYWEERFNPGVKPAPLRREMEVEGSECLLVGVVGRLVQDKGGAFFLKAAAQIAADLPSVRFLFAGRGSEEEPLRRQAASLGLSERVRFLGFREDIPEITAALDLSVLPSVDCDASSAVLKEAMALGKPVVATNIGGAREIVEHGRTGLIVPPGNPEALAQAMKQILQREDRGRAMGEEGQRRVKSEFSIQRLVEGTLLAYRRALRSSGRMQGPQRE